MPTIAKLKQQRAFLRREILAWDRYKQLQAEGREPEMTFDRFGRTHVRATRPAKRKPA